MSDFSDLLKSTRIAHGMSVPKLAIISGFDGKSIYDYENGSTAPPDGKTLKALCESMGATPQETRQIIQTAFDYYKAKAMLRYIDWNVT